MGGHWEREITHFLNWIAAAGHAAGTIKLRRYYLERFAASCLRGPYAVTVDDLARFLANPDWSPETRKSARSSLRAFYEWATTTDRIATSPAERLPRVRVPRAQPNPTPDPLLARAIAVASDRDRLMLLLGAYAGLRAGEIARVRWDEITDGVIVVRGKGGKVRRVPIHSRLIPAFAVERELRDRGTFGSGYRYGAPGSPYVFPGRDGGPITPGAVGKILRRNLGHKGHSLRHRFATTVHDATGNTLAVQQLLGHSKPETTAIYARITDRALRDVVESA